MDRDEAELYLIHAEAQLLTATYRHLATWEAHQAAAIVGAAGGWRGPGGLANARLRFVLFRPVVKPGTGLDSLPALSRVAQVSWRHFRLQMDEIPPALLYLAVRAARRAIEANPQDARAYLVLGKSYLMLLHNTRELTWSQRLGELGPLRRAQAAWALHRAVDLDRGLAEAHLHLGLMYQKMNYLDLALEHLENHRQLTQEINAPPGFSTEQFREQQTQNDQMVSRLAQRVRGQEKKYAAEAAQLRVVDKASAAVRRGLAGKARDMLRESDIAAFGRRGMILELDLLLKTGRSQDVRDWTGPEQKAALGPDVYHWFRAQALAATGDYALAEEELSQLALGTRGQGPVGSREGMALVVSQAVLGEQPGPKSLPHLMWRALLRGEFRARFTNLAQNLRREAGATVLRGLLALEEGDADEAEAAFRVALGFWKDRAAAASGAGLDFEGREVAQGCLEWLE
jgi:tetratricopeptide (TPR) repeat protein